MGSVWGCWGSPEPAGCHVPGAAARPRCAIGPAAVGPYGVSVKEVDVWYQFFKYLLIRPAMRLLVRPRLSGVEHIPARGPAILAGNHLGALDTLVLPALLRRRVTYSAKVELFQGRGPRGRVVAWFLRMVGQVPMDRSGGRASASGLDPIIEVLRNGGLVGIFPEGTRSPDGRMYRGHTGVARMALATGAPVIPVGMINTQSRRGPLGLPLSRDARIVVGEPLDYSAWRNRQNDQAVLRWVTNDIMAHIQQLSGQQYVDVYASRVKYGNLRGADLASYVKRSPLADLQTPSPVADKGA